MTNQSCHSQRRRESIYHDFRRRRHPCRHPLEGGKPPPLFFAVIHSKAGIHPLSSFPCRREPRQNNPNKKAQTVKSAPIASYYRRGITLIELHHSHSAHATRHAAASCCWLVLTRNIYHERTHSNCSSGNRNRVLDRFFGNSGRVNNTYGHHLN